MNVVSGHKYLAIYIDDDIKQTYNVRIVDKGQDGTIYAVDEATEQNMICNIENEQLVIKQFCN